MFHKHYCSDGHGEGIANWYVILIYQVESKKELRTKEVYWTNKFKTWALVELIVWEVYEAYQAWTHCKAFPADKQKDEKIFNLYLLFFFIHLYYYYYHYYYYYCYNIVVIIIVTIIITTFFINIILVIYIVVIVFINFYAVTILFLMEWDCGGGH